MSEVPLPSNTIGIHPPEEVASYRAKANSNAFLQAWLHRIDDVAPITNPAFAASRHRERFARSRDGRTVLGSFEHLDDLEFREILQNADAREFLRLMRIVLGHETRTAAERAAAAGISRTTEWRRRTQQRAA